MVNINTSNTAEGYDPNEVRDFSIPDGTYKAMLILLEEDVSSNGNDMIVANYTLTEGEHAGKEFKDFMVLTPKALFKLDAFLRATGLGEIGQDISLEYEQYASIMVYLKLKKGKPYNGAINSRIVGILPTEEGIGAKYAGDLPTGNAPASIGAPTAAEADDLPF